MKNQVREAALCATICVLFVLAAFVPGHVGLLGATTTGDTLVKGVMPAPDAEQTAWMAGPLPVPEPVDWPVNQARLGAGPLPVPEPVDWPVNQARLGAGPLPVPEPVDWPVAAL